MNGVPTGGGGDANANGIAIIPVIILAVGIALVLNRRTLPAATKVTFGGCTTWAILFAWRAATARVTGANLFMVPLVIAVIPGATIVTLTIRALARRRDRARGRARSRTADQ